ncbi:ATP-binding protein [Streptacidiphilus neutrinimicus]|uniref:ATP-binding protein n=1 Tax=Streptacidiphilus neutrinimicus TaxID=105420 RepID=UPI0009FD0F31|nr:ATP-binding protein [Streptacidiphilus neutrinimicus]
MSPDSATAASFGPRHLDLPHRDGVDRVAAGIMFVREALAEWHIGSGEEPAIDAVLVAAELLSNAERHGGGGSSMDLEHPLGLLRLTVHDANARAPRAVHPHLPDRVGGHGLFIVDRLSKAWGWRPGGGGKDVWAELPLPDR